MTLRVDLQHATLYVHDVTTFRFFDRQLNVILKHTFNRTTEDGKFGYTVNSTVKLNGVVGFRHLSA